MEARLGGCDAYRCPIFAPLALPVSFFAQISISPKCDSVWQDRLLKETCRKACLV
jgi:hypothetical protein